MTVHHLKFLQTNVHSLNNNKDSLYHFLHKNNIDISIISETFSKERSPININGYKYVNTPRNDGYGGAGLLIRNNITFKSIQLPPNSDEIQAHIVQLTTYDLYIISMYFKPLPSIITIENYLERLLRSLNGKNFILAGDLNAKDRLWGKQSPNQMGQVIKNIMLSHNMHLHNDGLRFNKLPVTILNNDDLVGIKKKSFVIVNLAPIIDAPNVLDFMKSNILKISW